MIREGVTAALVLAAAVAAAHPTSRVRPISPRATVRVAAPQGESQQFQFRGVVFTVPAGWSVQRGNQRPFRTERVRVTARGVGPQLTFSDSVQPVHSWNWSQITDGLRPRSAASTKRAAASGPSPIAAAAIVQRRTKSRRETDAEPASAIGTGGTIRDLRSRWEQPGAIRDSGRSMRPTARTCSRACPRKPTGARSQRSPESPSATSVMCFAVT